MECPVFIEFSFAKMKAYAGSESREEGQLFRTTSARGNIASHS